MTVGMGQVEYVKDKIVFKSWRKKMKWLLREIKRVGVRF